MSSYFDNSNSNFNECSFYSQNQNSTQLDSPIYNALINYPQEKSLENEENLSLTAIYIIDKKGENEKSPIRKKKNDSKEKNLRGNNNVKASKMANKTIKHASPKPKNVNKNKNDNNINENSKNEPKNQKIRKTCINILGQIVKSKNNDIIESIKSDKKLKNSEIIILNENPIASKEDLDNYIFKIIKSLIVISLMKLIIKDDTSDSNNSLISNFVEYQFYKKNWKDNLEKYISQETISEIDKIYNNKTEYPKTNEFLGVTPYYYYKKIINDAFNNENIGNKNYQKDFKFLGNSIIKLIEGLAAYLAYYYRIQEKKVKKKKKKKNKDKNDNKNGDKNKTERKIENISNKNNDINIDINFVNNKINDNKSFLIEKDEFLKDDLNNYSYDCNSENNNINIFKEKQSKSNQSTNCSTYNFNLEEIEKGIRIDNLYKIIKNNKSLIENDKENFLNEKRKQLIDSYKNIKCKIKAIKILQTLDLDGLILLTKLITIEQQLYIKIKNSEVFEKAIKSKIDPDFNLDLTDNEKSEIENQIKFLRNTIENNNSFLKKKKKRNESK